MSRLFQLLLFLAVLALFPLTASARITDHQHYDGCGHDTGGGTTQSVPELDPSAAAAALALLAGGAVLIRERRRKIAR